MRATLLVDALEALDTVWRLQIAYRRYGASTVMVPVSDSVTSGSNANVRHNDTTTPEHTHSRPGAGGDIADRRAHTQSREAPGVRRDSSVRLVYKAESKVPDAQSD